MVHRITWDDLEFRRIPVDFRSTCGVPQTRWMKVGMPRIPHNVIDGVFYLYKDRADALAGKDPGGTGFIVLYDGIFTDQVPGHHFYGITNWHVACSAGFSTIRLNRKDGGTDVIEFGPENWYFLPGKYDVAVIPLVLDETLHDVSSISTAQFTKKSDHVSGWEIGIGEDVFMIGLFVDHGGVTTNVPSARFGNISMLPSARATIKQSTGYHGESYVVDMHSRAGFSGSPVYVYRTFGSDLTEVWGSPFDDLELEEAFRLPPPIEGFGVSGMRIGPQRGRLRARRLFQLLGIHWGQFPERWQLQNKPALKKLNESKDLIVEGGYVEGLSGMTCVIPAWQIIEVLDMPDLKDLRHPGIVAAKKAAESAPKAESAAPLADDANPNHLEDFTRLVDVAARKRPQGDQT